MLMIINDNGYQLLKLLKLFTSLMIEIANAKKRKILRLDSPQVNLLSLATAR